MPSFQNVTEPEGEGQGGYHLRPANKSGALVKDMGSSADCWVSGSFVAYLISKSQFPHLENGDGNRNCEY